MLLVPRHNRIRSGSAVTRNSAGLKINRMLKWIKKCATDSAHEKTPVGFWLDHGQAGGYGISYAGDFGGPEFVSRSPRRWC